MIRTFVAFAGLADDRCEQGILAGEIGVERRLRDACFARDGIHARRAVALRHEKGGGRIEHLADAVAVAVAEVADQGLVSPGIVERGRLQGSQMRLGQVRDMDVVADACPVRRRVIVAEDRDRLTVPGGTVLMTSLQPAADVLKDIHKKEAPYNLALIRAKASFSGLWVYKEDHTEARILGALAKIQPEFLSLDAVCQAIKEAEWGSDLKVASARKAYERLETRPVNATEGNPETPYAFEMPKWWEMREGVSIPAIPIGKPMEGGKGYVPERNPYFKKFTTRTMRPVIDFDKCVKCTLCWIQCPDSCFDVTPDGLYDANMESCCGCGVCEAVCPAKECITMVNEACFEDNASQWEMWRKDKGAYKSWMTAKINDKSHIVRSHGFRFRGQYEEEIKKDMDTGGMEITTGIPGENAAAKKL